ncbi:MAG TPA: GNAT family N-acetyltransferase [Fimbriimonadaceae bacterium]|nr:GNAT family N-acetyltransferase [Fimbriimonadaceae bacterium]
MIRPAEPQDVPRIFELVRELAVYERLEHKLVGTPARLREHLFGDRPFVESLVGEVDGAIVAYSLFFPSYSSFLMKPGYWLEDIYVQPEHRGKGLGKALLRAIVQKARDAGYGRVEWSVLDWNQPSIDFYRSIGAVHMADWNTYRLEDETLRRFADGLS